MAGNEEGSGVTGHRHGSRTRTLTGTFGPIEIAVPRARLTTAEGKTAEWKSQALRAYQRRTLAADALIASTYLAGTNTRRVRRALAALFGGTVGKDTVSRTWRKVKSDWDAWNTRSLEDETDPLAQFGLDAINRRQTKLDDRQAAFDTANRAGSRRDAGRCPAPYHCRAEHYLEGLTAISIAASTQPAWRRHGAISARPPLWRIDVEMRWRIVRQQSVLTQALCLAAYRRAPAV